MRRLEGREGLSEENPSRPLQTAPTLPKDFHKWVDTELRLRNRLVFNASSPAVPFSFLPAFTGGIPAAGGIFP